jgi:hypothetical protein
VEILWKNRASPVDAVSAQKKDRVSTQAFRPAGACGARFVGSFACMGGPAAQEWRLFRNRFEAPTSTAVSSPPSPIRTPVQRFDETIGGRRYQIEVSAVSSNRWRAQIVRAPGVPTAMMPFYGATPDAAAGQLSAWLALAYRTAAPPVSS